MAAAVVALAVGAPPVAASFSVSSSAGVRADQVGVTVRDTHGRRVGTVREIQIDHNGDVLNVVISLGPLPGGGERYVVVPRWHLESRGGDLRFNGARERLVDAPRRADGAERP